MTPTSADFRTKHLNGLSSSYTRNHQHQTATGENAAFGERPPFKALSSLGKGQSPQNKPSISSYRGRAFASTESDGEICRGFESNYSSRSKRGAATTPKQRIMTGPLENVTAAEVLRASGSPQRNTVPAVPHRPPTAPSSANARRSGGGSASRTSLQRSQQQRTCPDGSGNREPSVGPAARNRSRDRRPNISSRGREVFCSLSSSGNTSRDSLAEGQTVDSRDKGEALTTGTSAPPQTPGSQDNRRRTSGELGRTNRQVAAVLRDFISSDDKEMMEDMLERCCVLDRYIAAVDPPLCGLCCPVICRELELKDPIEVAAGRRRKHAAIPYTARLALSKLLGGNNTLDASADEIDETHGLDGLREKLGRSAFVLSLQISGSAAERLLEVLSKLLSKFKHLEVPDCLESGAAVAPKRQTRMTKDTDGGVHTVTQLSDLIASQANNLAVTLRRLIGQPVPADAFTPISNPELPISSEGILSPPIVCNSAPPCSPQNIGASNATFFSSGGGSVTHSLPVAASVLSAESTPPFLVTSTQASFGSFTEASHKRGIRDVHSIRTGNATARHRVFEMAADELNLTAVPTLTGTAHSTASPSADILAHQAQSRQFRIAGIYAALPPAPSLEHHHSHSRSGSESRSPLCNYRRIWPRRRRNRISRATAISSAVNRNKDFSEEIKADKGVDEELDGEIAVSRSRRVHHGHAVVAANQSSHRPLGTAIEGIDDSRVGSAISRPATSSGPPVTSDRLPATVTPIPVRDPDCLPSSVANSSGPRKSWMKFLRKYQEPQAASTTTPTASGCRQRRYSRGCGKSRVHSLESQTFLPRKQNDQGVARFLDRSAPTTLYADNKQLPIRELNKVEQHGNPLQYERSHATSMNESQRASCGAPQANHHHGDDAPATAPQRHQPRSTALSTLTSRPFGGDPSSPSGASEAASRLSSENEETNMDDILQFLAPLLSIMTFVQSTECPAFILEINPTGDGRRLPALERALSLWLYNHQVKEAQRPSNLCWLISHGSIVQRLRTAALSHKPAILRRKECGELAPEQIDLKWLEDDVIMDRRQDLQLVVTPLPVRRGDHIYRQIRSKGGLSLMTHHGIYVGRGVVIHFSGNEFALRSLIAPNQEATKLRKTTILEFMKFGGTLYVEQYANKASNTPRTLQGPAISAAVATNMTQRTRSCTENVQRPAPVLSISDMAYEKSSIIRRDRLGEVTPWYSQALAYEETATRAEFAYAFFHWRRKISRGTPDLEIGLPLSIEKQFAKLSEHFDFPAYDLLMNNCEHFCRWCKTGTAVSLQVDLVGIAVDSFVRGLQGITMAN